MSKKVLWVLPNHGTGSLTISANQHYRACLPYRFLQEPLKELDIELHIDQTIYDGTQWTGIIQQKESSNGLVFYINDRRWKGCRNLWDIDDNLHEVPDWSVYKQNIEDRQRVSLLLATVDSILCSTEPLAQYLNKNEKVKSVKTNYKTYHCPNLVDLNEYDQCKSSFANRDKDQEVRLLWRGSGTHSKDLLIIVPALLNIAKHFKNKIHIYSFGDASPELYAKLSPSQLTYIFPVPFSDYFSILSKIKANIGLVPLKECEFNRCKSDIAWMELTLSGAATICSKCEAYKDAGQQVDNTDAAWEDAIGKNIDLILSGKTPDFYEEDRLNIMANHSWNNDSPNRQKWITAFQEIVK